MSADCRYCLGRCEPEIHRATVAVRGWLHDELERKLSPVDTAPKKSKNKPVANVIKRERRYRDDSHWQL